MTSPSIDEPGSFYTYALKGLYTAAPTDFVKDVVEKMRLLNSSYVVVLAGRELVGIFTERDLVKAIARGIDIDRQAVSTLMTRQVATITDKEASNLVEVLERFRRYQIRHLPVVNEKKELIGIITPECIRETLQPYDLLKLRLVKEVMEPRVITQTKDCPITDIIQLMYSRKISCVAITEEDYPIGIVTERDILKLVCSHLSWDKTLARDLMSHPIILIKSEDTLWEAHRKMQEHGIRRLGVVEKHNSKIVGVLTQSSILKALNPLHLQEMIQTLKDSVEAKTSQLEELTENHRQAEKKLQSILKVASVAVISFRVYSDRTYKREYISKAAKDVYGYSSEEFIEDEKLWASRVFPEDLPIIQDIFYRGVFACEATNVEYRFYTKEQGLRWISESITAKQLEDCWQAVIVATDVTKSKEIEQQLLEKEYVLSQIGNNIVGYLFVKAPDSSQYFYVSSGYENIWGPSSIGKYQNPLLYIEQIHEEDREGLATVLAKETTEENIQHEFRIKSPEGNCRWLKLRSFPVYNDRKELVRRVGMVEDITDKKLKDEMLIYQAQREKILRDISNKIRQSLDLNYILNTGVEEIRRFIQADRVVIWQFDENYSGRIVVESVIDENLSIASTFIQDHCFSREYVHQYKKGLLKATGDVSRANLKGCHLDMLVAYSVKSNLISSILVGDKLWGLLIAHQCRVPREWGPQDLSILEQISEQLSLAIQQSELYLKTQRQAETEKALNRVINTIRNSLELPKIFEAATRELYHVISVDRVVIVQYFPREKLWRNVAEYHREDLTGIIGAEIPDEGNYIADIVKQGQVVSIENTNNLQGETNCTQVHTVPGAWLIVPLYVNTKVWGTITLMRVESNIRWSEEQKELASAVGDQLAIAIQQSELYQELQQANQVLQSLATMDGLTKVSNRRRFDEYLIEQWNALALKQEKLCLLLIDVDYFKKYNDNYGHLAGDECLINVAQTIKNIVLRNTDLVSRYGGEEFAVILPKTDLVGGMKVAHNIQMAIRNLHIPHEFSPTGIVTVSQGVVVMKPSVNQMPKILIDHADQALYQAKHQGRDRFVVGV